MRSDEMVIACEMFQGKLIGSVSSLFVVGRFVDILYVLPYQQDLKMHYCFVSYDVRRVPYPNHDQILQTNFQCR
jgi:hypothetical protein